MTINDNPALEAHIRASLETWPNGFMRPQVWRAPRVWEVELRYESFVCDDGAIVADVLRDNPDAEVCYLGSRILAKLSAPGYMDQTETWLIDDVDDWRAFEDAYRDDDEAEDDE